MTRTLPLALALLFSGGLATYGQDTPEPPPAEEPQAGEGEGEGDPGQKGPKNGKKNRKKAQDDGVESPIATALAEQLHVAPNYRDGRVELVYTFANPEEIEDWENAGFQRAEQANPKGRRNVRNKKKNKKNRTLALATSRAGLLTHKIPFLEDVEVEFTCHIERGATRTDFVVGVGKAGVRHGQAFVKRSGSGFKSVGRPFADASPFLGGQKATLTIKASGALFTASLPKGTPQTTEGLRDKLAGRVYLYTTQAHLVVHRVVIRGAVDLEAFDLK